MKLMKGILVLENFEETIKRGKAVSLEQIMTESKTLAGKEASGVLGTIKVLPFALNKIKLARVNPSPRNNFNYLWF